MSGLRVTFVVPEGVDDPARVSGGNVYDRRLADALGGLGGLGVELRMLRAADADDLGPLLAALPRDALVLVDGLVALAAPAELRAHATRLRLAVLAHWVASAVPGIPDAAGLAERERDALHAARLVIATSAWTRDELAARGLARPGRIALARPGTDAATPTVGSASGGRLLSVGVVAPHKGQDVLVAALAGLAGLPGWTCRMIGSLDADPAFATATAEAIRDAGLAARVELAGTRTGAPLAAAYAASDLVVVPSRAESYGLVVAEALARGIPVVAARVGGIPEALGDGGAGLLVPPDDPAALAEALRGWLADAGLRETLRAAAAGARATARGWDGTARDVARALHALRSAPAEPASPERHPGTRRPPAPGPVEPGPHGRGPVGADGRRTG